ncbi:hypothetical protein R1flu_016992 [Riccia fluitans]|uniref:Uncharacterized protein n=1 Tax=Riccia fluitans TaxID=41844 RepID=A0ABD1YNG1_9MARC
MVTRIAGRKWREVRMIDLTMKECCWELDSCKPLSMNLASCDSVGKSIDYVVMRRGEIDPGRGEGSEIFGPECEILMVTLKSTSGGRCSQACLLLLFLEQMLDVFCEINLEW